MVAFVFRFGGCGGDLSVRDADGIGGAGITWSSISIKQQHISTKRHIILVDGWCGLYIILSIMYIMPTRRRTRHARKSRRHARSHSRRTRRHRGGNGNGLITAPMTTATDAINTVTTGATNAVGTAVDETKKATTSAYNTITSAFSGLFGSSSSTTPATTTTTGGRRSRRRRHSRRHSRK